MTNSNKRRSPLQDKQLRRPGQSLEPEIEKLRLNIIIYLIITSFFIIFAFYAWWLWYINLPPQPIVASTLAVIIAVYSSVKIRKLFKQLRNHQQGQLGEREVGQIINPLIAKGYTIFHDVTGGKFNIDHVVLSPRGIFAIETKTYSKPSRGIPEVRFDGNNVTLTGHPPDAAPVDEAVRHARWLRGILGKDSKGKLFKVKPVIVFLNWYYRDTGHNKDIWVLNPLMLEVQIAREPISLTEFDIEIAKVRLEPYSTISTDELVE